MNDDRLKAAKVKKILAIIPARGGSKGVPHKNILNIAGKPLISYSICQALESNYITRTIVSTDDEEIASTSRLFGAEIPFIRPKEFAQDMSPDIDVFLHALQWLKENESYTPDLVVHLRPTGPVRNIKIIDAAIKLILNDKYATSLRSVSTPIQTPYKMWTLNGEYIQPLVKLKGLKDAHSQPRQKLPKPYWQNGYIDIIRPKVIIEKKSMTGERVIPFIIEEPIYEIDYPESIPLVEEALLKNNNKMDENDQESFSYLVRDPV